MQPIRRPFRALTTNATDSSFPAKIATITEPTGNGVLDLIGAGSVVPEWLRLWAVGVGADNDAYSVRIIGWHKVGTAAPFLWVPTIVAELGVVLSAAVGIAGTTVPATERFADTLTVTSEGTFTSDVTRFGSIRVHSPASDLIAHAVIPLEAFDKLEFTFKDTTNTPTKNLLLSFKDN